MTALPGLALDGFAAWFEEVRPGEVRGALQARLLAGGKSNLTYEVTDGDQRWVVRRPPLGHVLATAHDMRREHCVITALGPTDVPVPKTYGFCDDTDVIGVPFYVMERIFGTPYQLSSQLEALGPDRTRAISIRMVDTLATLHDVRPERVGLAEFGRPEGFLARQVRRWKQQLDASWSRELPGAAELHDRLGAHVPEGAPSQIVHGDFRLDNLLVDTDDGVAAVIDWEMAALGDPLTDLALLVLYQRLGELGLGGVLADASSAPGFLSEGEILEYYAGLSRRDLSNIGFYLGLASFKLAAILEGVHYRHVQGQTVGMGFEGVGSLVEPVIAAGLGWLQEHD